MMRRPLTLVLVALAVGAGCSDGTSGTDAEVGSDPGDPGTTTSVEATTSTTTTTATTTTAPTTTTTATTTTAPPVIQSDLEVTYRPAPAAAGSLLVHDRSSVFVVDLAADPVEPQIVLGPLDGLIVVTARLATDGSLVVELTDDVAVGEPNTIHKIVHLGVDGSIVDLIDDAALFAVAEFGGVEQVLVGELPDGEVEEADLVAVPLDGRPPVAFGTAFAPEYGVSSIDVVDGVAVVSAYSDLTEQVSFTNAEGDVIARHSPTDGLEYGAEPSVSHATFSPDGSEVAWIEGPEHYIDVDADEATWHGDWRVRSFDAATGEERLSQPFDFPNADPFTQLVSGLAHTGDRLVISRAVVDDGLVFDLELLVLDLTTEEPEMYELPVTGVAHVVG